MGAGYAPTTHLFGGILQRYLIMALITFSQDAGNYSSTQPQGASLDGSLASGSLVAR